jgi:hypothetical protein
MSLTVIDVCSLRATIFAPFFGVIPIFTLAKAKIIPGYKIDTHLRKSKAVNWWSAKLSSSKQSELVCKSVPNSQDHAFTETRDKQPGFDHLQPKELQF